MSHEFLTTQNIARTALPRLIENLVFPNLVHKDFSGEFASNLGDTIRIRKPVNLEAREFDATKGVTTQDIKEDFVTIKLDKIATVDIEISALEGVHDFKDASRQFIEPAAVALAQKINSDGLELYKDIPYIGGTAGTTPASLTDLATARKILTNNKVPDSPRYAVWDPEAEASYSTIPSIVNAEKSGSTQALRNGSIGRLFGFENYVSQAVKKHTPAAAGTALKVKTATVAGDTKLTITGTTLTGNFIKGDVLVIEGKSYVVTQDSSAADGNEIADVAVYPALPELKASTVVTFTAAHTANMVFNPMAFAFVTRPLVKPAGVESYVTSYNGISLRVTRGYDMKYKKESMSMDVLYSYKTIYPELAAVYMG